MILAYPENLKLLWLLPPVAAVTLWFFLRQKKNRQLFALHFSKIAPEFDLGKQILRQIILFAGLALLLLSMTGPQWGKKEEQTVHRGIEIFIAIDCSQSMMAQDYLPSRMEFSKTILKKLADRLAGDKIGVIAYAGMAYVKCPLTTDTDAVKLFIEDLDYRSVPLQGTNIAVAIETAAAHFKSESDKALIILSDGESLEGNALEAAKEAAQQGIHIYTIGIGSPEGHTIEINDTRNNLFGRKQDEQGNPVISRLDEKTLSQIAEISGGTYVRADYENVFLDKIAADIGRLDSENLVSRNRTAYIHRYQWFLLPSFLFLVLGSLISERKKQKI